MWLPVVIHDSRVSDNKSVLAQKVFLTPQKLKALNKEQHYILLPEEKL